MPDNCYYQTHLQQAGVRFDYNVVDTALKRGLGVPFYLVLALTAVLSYLKVSETVLPETFSPNLLTLLCFIYLCLSLGKYCYYGLIRSRLRKDPAPIACEAYAVVILDGKFSALTCKVPWALKAAVVYKECGTRKPRFFLGAAVSARRLPQLNGGQLVRVFIDRKNPKIYSVDESSALQTAGARQRRWSLFEISPSNQANKICRKDADRRP